MTAIYIHRFKRKCCRNVIAISYFSIQCNYSGQLNI